MTTKRSALTSELGDGGVLFGDGIESDQLQIDSGQEIWIGIADRTLRLSLDDSAVTAREAWIAVFDTISHVSLANVRYLS